MKNKIYLLLLGVVLLLLAWWVQLIRRASYQHKIKHVKNFKA